MESRFRGGINELGLMKNLWCRNMSLSGVHSFLQNFWLAEEKSHTDSFADLKPGPPKVWIAVRGAAMGNFLHFSNWGAAWIALLHSV